MPSFQRHVFVCTNERAPDNPKGCCKAKGGIDVRDRLKAELSARGLSKIIRANNAGCLDQCDAGVTVAILDTGLKPQSLDFDGQLVA